MVLRHLRLATNVHGLHKPVTKSTAVVIAVCLLLLVVPKTDAESLSEYLWNQTESIRNNALSTYFVQGIGNGTLNPTAFGSYMIQDSVYIYNAKRSIDSAVYRAPEGKLKEFLRGKSASFERYYHALFKKWHIKDPADIKVCAACQSYADYEHQIAATEDTIYMIVAMLPCYKLWPWLGQQLQSANHGVYDDWFNSNFDPQYEGYKALDALVDAADVKQTISRNKALEVYTRCMLGEYEFFDSVQETQ
ncbi:uncharacterized protein LOC110465566 [Mizuhopecten yessoensis]|uniref:Thiamine biosynthesis multifunctional protein ThiED n=1 Tax=Mizuhopecten yessoensis TaxID=6573 RepID=A0A210PRC2_MIZYE|nr:uncharacterized protein LOC110465566 [Mizuhopecten yessoensis]OWF39039.1 Thiamine biosynthesis multifunctional protein ThiED [Mizuhopecten yessoensis]